MPTLIGPSAALAQPAGITQLPTPVATAPVAKSKLPRKRRRVRWLRSANIGLNPFSSDEALWPEFDEDNGEDEDENVGDDGRHHPWQRGAQRADDAHTRDRPAEGSDAADHDRATALEQEAQAEIGEQ